MVATTTHAGAATVDEWALDYVLTQDLATKLSPPPVPELWQSSPEPLRISRPGRPLELRAGRRGTRTPKPAGLRDPRCRARLLHAFWFHELSAAELMCWALLAFADSEPAFRRGLLRVALDEIRHMQLYREHIRCLGFEIGSFAVRDWFWDRVPSSTSKIEFVALMGMGFEAANLEHAPHFAAQFKAAGDETGALLQLRIAREELAHVRFATTWFRRWRGGCQFDDWRRSLPPPLSPLVLRGKTLDREARLRAGMPPEFVAALGLWQPE